MFIIIPQIGNNLCKFGKSGNQHILGCICRDHLPHTNPPGKCHPSNQRVHTNPAKISAKQPHTVIAVHCPDLAPLPLSKVLITFLLAFPQNNLLLRKNPHIHRTILIWEIIHCIKFPIPVILRPLFKHFKTYVKMSARHLTGNKNTDSHHQDHS